jgi:cell division protein FtsL
MSRLERNSYKKIRRRKIRLLFKFLFILVMTINLAVCIFIIDKSAKDMLGPDAYILNSAVDDIKNDIDKKISEIFKAKEKIIKLYDDSKNKT